MAKANTAYTQFKEKAVEYQQYLGIAQRVQKNEVIPGIHNLAAKSLRLRGLEDLASDLEHSDATPNNHALYPIMQQGVEDSQKTFNNFGKDHLVVIVNSKDLKRETVAQTLLMLPPEGDIAGYEALSQVHKSTAEFYADLYLYQQDGKLSPDQKAGAIHNMKVRVSNHYAGKFEDDKEFAAKLRTFIAGYDDIAVAQCKRLAEAKVKEFSTALNAANAGAYVKAMSLSDDKRNAFYQALLSADKG